MSNENNVESTSVGDDANFNADSQQPSFDDMQVPMGPMAKHLGLEDDLPEDEEYAEGPDDSVDEVPPEEDTTDEDETPDQEDDTYEGDEDEDDDTSSTQDSELLEEEEIDWGYKVPVKIDGEVTHLSLEELRKGYATDQSLSKKGNKISEQRKELEAEQAEQLKELNGMAALLQEQLQQEETELAKEYHEFDAKIKEARKNGDTFELNELKDQRETAQEAYWTARKKREGVAAAVEEKQKAQAEIQNKEIIEKFQSEIAVLVPTFQEDAQAIQQFAIDEGIPESLLPLINDANVVKFINDYRQLKQKASKGAVKRKATPKAKSSPVKKGPSRNKKQEKAKLNVRNKVLTGAGSEGDQLDFLKNLSKFR